MKKINIYNDYSTISISLPSCCYFCGLVSNRDSEFAFKSICKKCHKKSLEKIIYIIKDNKFLTFLKDKHYIGIKIDNKLKDIDKILINRLNKKIILKEIDKQIIKRAIKKFKQK